MYALDPVPETVAPNRARASARAMRAKGRTARAQGKNRNDNPSGGVRLCARIRAHMKLRRAPGARLVHQSRARQNTS